MTIINYREHWPALPIVHDQTVQFCDQRGRDGKYGCTLPAGHAAPRHEAGGGQGGVYATWEDAPTHAPIVQPPHVEGSTIQERFESFHALNPWVLEALEELTREWVKAGHNRMGVGMLTEVLRWQYGRTTVGDAFKLNNNLRSRYARLMIERHPEWASVFEVRELKAP